jgi:hypothetical protein
MAEITRVGIPSLASLLLPANCKHTGLYAGEALLAGDACYIKAADNKVWKSTGAAANAAAVVDGFAALPAPVGEAVTLVFNCTIQYGGVVAATPMYLSGTVPGGLADAASTGGTTVIAKAVDTTRIYVQKSY